MPANPTALVTGGSRGIGRGIAVGLAGIGYDVMINFARDRESAERTARECVEAGGRCGKVPRVEVHQADVGEMGQVAGLMAEMKARLGRLDLLVNNAGVAPEVRADLLETSEESFDRCMRINLKAPFFLSQLAGKWMVEQVSSEGAGELAPKIINIGSVSAYTASITRGEYCVSKAGLSMVTSLFADRLARHGIHVFEIRAGVIATDMTSVVKEKYDALITEGLTPIRRWGKAEDVSKAVMAIASGNFPFSTGEVINVDGGFHLRRL